MIYYKSKKIAPIFLKSKFKDFASQKMTKRSMYKNDLFISVIVNVLFRNFYYFLKMLSTCLNINILPLEKLEPLVRSCPFSQVLRFVNFLYKIVFMCHTLSFNEKCNVTFYTSNRVNNNCYASFPCKKRKIINIQKRSFCTSKKINREISKNYKLKANAWKKNTKLLDKKIYNCINKNLPVSSLINDVFIENLNQLVLEYNLLVSEILDFRKNLLETSSNEFIRITQNNIPHLIIKSQCLFIESPSVSLLSILEIKKNKGSDSGGVGKYKFKNLNSEKKKLQSERLKGTKFAICKKKLPLEMMPKNCQLSDDEVKKLKLDVESYNLDLINILLKKTLIKTIQKNYKGQPVKRVWIDKKNSLEGRPLGIPTLRDRVLQKIIWLSILPIAEFQADIFSFAYRPRRSALMCTSILYNRCVQTQKFPRKKYYPSEANRISYEKHPLKFRISYRVLLCSFGKKQRKRRKLYEKFFYILKTLKSKSKSVSSKKKFQFSKYITVWNFDIQKCFDNINHQTIIKLTPLCDKYLFFLKQWLIAPIVGPQKKGSKVTVSVKPKFGIPQGSIIGPGICNLVLDGIDDLLLKLKRNGKITLKSSLNNKAKSFLDKLAISKLITKNHYNPKTDISYLRYADDIIFYGFHNKETFLLIQNEVTKFLADRGLSIKPSTNNIFQLKPNSAFSFLGFRYFFPSRFHKKKLNKGKFTKKRYTPFNIAENRLSENLRSRIFITMDQNAFKTFKTRIRKIFKKGHFYLSVAQLIDILNEKMRGFALYFSYSEKIRIQLNSLDNSIRKWFWKWLKKKYGSKPKLLTFLHQNYLNINNFFAAEKKVLIPLCKVNVNGQRSLLTMRPTKELLKKNIFLNSEEYDKFDLSQDRLSALNLLLRNKELTLKQYQLVLLNRQQNLCSICNGLIDISNEKVEFHHNPPVIFLRKKLFCILLEISEFEDVFSLTPNCPNILKKINLYQNESFIIDIWKEQVFDIWAQITLAHKKCNQDDGKILAKESKKEIAQVRKLFPNCIYPFYSKINLFVRNACSKPTKYLLNKK